MARKFLVFIYGKDILRAMKSHPQRAPLEATAPSRGLDGKVRFLGTPGGGRERAPGAINLVLKDHGPRSPFREAGKEQAASGSRGRK